MIAMSRPVGRFEDPSPPQPACDRAARDDREAGDPRARRDG
jgi:hypothetical protein